MIATLTSNAQITLPKIIRGTLGLHPDDKVDFAPQPDGRITVSKARRAGKTPFAALQRAVTAA